MYNHNYYHHHFPCLHCHPHSYIRMVHNLIERCLVLHMDQDQCINYLAKYARIRPHVTLTVWKELLKENKDFFQAYFQSLPTRPFISSRGFQVSPRNGRGKPWSQWRKRDRK